MRPSRCRCQGRDLAVLMLALAICRSPAFAGGPAKPKAVSPKPPQAAKAPHVVEPFNAEGRGVTEEYARASAVDDLRGKIDVYLKEHYPDITYSPSTAELQAMSQFGPPEPWENPDPQGKPELNRVKVEVKLHAELTDAHLKEFSSKSRQLLAEHRQNLLARGLAGAVALLVVGTGYLRLEEKLGRHKVKLGLVAVGVLGLVGLTLLVLGFDVF
jgi:hypothetical protein